MENLKEVQYILEDTKTGIEDFEQKKNKFSRELETSKNVLSLTEDFMSVIDSFSDSTQKHLEDIEELLLEDEEIIEMTSSVDKDHNSLLSARHEIASILDDLVIHIPDILLRENLEILARILRDEAEEIKNHFIYPRLVKKST